MEKMKKPALYSLYLPYISASLPNSGRKMVSVSIYAIATHSMVSIETSNILFMAGMATFTILTSRADMVAPKSTVARINHLPLWQEEMMARRCDMV